MEGLLVKLLRTSAEEAVGKEAKQLQPPALERRQRPCPAEAAETAVQADRAFRAPLGRTEESAALERPRHAVVEPVPAAPVPPAQVVKPAAAEALVGVPATAQYPDRVRLRRRTGRLA